MYIGPKLHNDNVIFAMDAGSNRSYNGDNLTYNDIITGESYTVEGATKDADGGGCWDFAGSTEDLLMRDLTTELNGIPEASLEMWIKLDVAANGASLSGLIQCSGYDNTNGTLYCYTNQSIYLDVFRATRFTVSTNTLSIFDATEWHMLTITNKAGAGGYRVFINGKLLNSTTGSAVVAVVTAGGGAFKIAESSVSRNLGGKIASTFIHNIALTDAQVLDNYNITKHRYA